METNATSHNHYTPLPQREGQGGGSVDAFDSLIRETLERRELLADLDRAIIADVRRQARRAWVRRWARVVAFSFGLPLALLVFFTCTYLYIKANEANVFLIAILALPTLALIYSTNHAFKTFSPEEV